MNEKSFAPIDPARAPAARPRYPEETPAIVRRYLWPDLAKEPPAEPPAQADTAITPGSPRP